MEISPPTISLGLLEFNIILLPTQLPGTTQWQKVEAGSVIVIDFSQCSFYPDYSNVDNANAHCIFLKGKDEFIK